MYTQKSYVLKPAEADKKWYLIDAKDMVVGRLATEISDILRGKNNPKYTPHTDSGDFVVVVNAEKVKFTGNKWRDKKYFSVSQYISGLRARSASEVLERTPELIVMNAVKGMLPKTSLGRKQLTKLKVFIGESHEHDAQKPEVYNIK